MFSFELAGEFLLLWIAHLWIVAWPSGSDEKRPEAVHTEKACIATPKRRRNKPNPGRQGPQGGLTADFCSNVAWTPEPNARSESLLWTELDLLDRKSTRLNS